MTKTFVGLVFLQLAEDGAVDLDARMAEVPEFTAFCRDLAAAPTVFGKNLDCDAPITMRNLLTHTASGDPGASFLYNPILFSRLSRYLEWTVNDSTEIEGDLNELARQIEARILDPAGMTRRLAFVVLANGEGVWWENPLTKAAVERSAFARAFLGRFVFEEAEAR